MEENQLVATLIDSTTSKIHQLQKAFAELENHRAVTLNLKWKQLEEHFHGLQRSLKRRFTELEDHEKEFDTKIVRARETLEKREAAVVAKEQASLERLQEKRDAAVSAISIALQNHNHSFNSDNRESITEDLVVEVKHDGMVTENISSDSKKPVGSANVEVKSYPELVKLCQKMDAEGLHKFISDNRKDLTALKEEIPIALRAAPSPASFVLDSLKGFHEMPNSDSKKDCNLVGLRRSCIMLMECLKILLINLEMDSLSNLISKDVKERAKAIADYWKPKLDELPVDARNGNSLEAHAFLQLLATFGITSYFDEDDLSKLIPMVCRRHQTADLCRFLGLSNKIPGVIAVLVNCGRQIDAVNLAFAFKLTDQFSPVSLLKSYLDEASKVSSPVRPGNTSPNAQSDVNDKELTAIKVVIRCIEEHKLEEQYPLYPLQQRITQLEKAKAEKKRATEVTKPQTKRPRANGAGYVPRATNVATEKSFYPRMADRYQHYVYERSYAYPGPADNHVTPLMGTTAYSLPPVHGNYFGSGYHYQTAYLH